MVEREEELKLMLNRNDYNNLKAIANSFANETIIQVNHYFDTSNFLLKNNGLTLRVREKDNKYVLNLKVKNSNLKSAEYRSSSEYKVKIDKDIFMRVKAYAAVLEDYQEIYNIINERLGTCPRIEYAGSLTTERTLFKPVESINNFIIDKNEYLDFWDWELEYEMNHESEIPIVLDWLNKHNIGYSKSQNGKYERFINRIIMLKEKL